MKVCLIATELAGYSKMYGGFGVLTRDIAKGLASRGVEVYVIIPRQQDEKPIKMDEHGFTVVTIPISPYTGIYGVKRFKSIFEMIDADIYHSEEPSVGTALAMEAMPHKKHIITFQDPRTMEERKIDWGSYKGLQVFKFRVSYYLSVKKYIKKADGLFCQAQYIIPKVMKMYSLKTTPGFLPNPVKITNRPLAKDSHPTVCFLGRWDTRKNPELFFELAKQFPRIKFIAAGASLTDPERDRKLREKYGNIPNLVMPGWVDNIERSKILEKAWIMINTSYRECLPVSYLEAASYQCSIISYENPDDFPVKFGYHVKKVNLNEYANGLKFLLRENKWEKLGNLGYEYVKKTFEYEKVIDKHIQIYKDAMRLSKEHMAVKNIWKNLPESRIKNIVKSFYHIWLKW